MCSVFLELVNRLEKSGLPYQVGKTWTTDAPYRETPGKVLKRKAEGCLTVEMESAGLIAVAQYIVCFQLYRYRKPGSSPGFSLYEQLDAGDATGLPAAFDPSVATIFSFDVESMVK